MHIVPDADDPEKIFFLFFEDQAPSYTFIGKEQANRHSFDAAMIANDLRVQKDQQKGFVVILFSTNFKQNPMTMINFTFTGNTRRLPTMRKRTSLFSLSLDRTKSLETSTAQWTIAEMEEPIEFEPETYNIFINAFIVEGNFLLIFCNQTLLSCNSHDLSNMKMAPLDILKHLEEDS